VKLFYLYGYSKLGPDQSHLYKRGRGAARVNPTPSRSRHRSPTLVPFAPRGPSSPEAQRFLPARVGYLEGAASRAQGQTVGEGLTWWTTTQLHGTATMCMTTPSRFRCTCASSGNPVIYNLQLILFMRPKFFVS